MRRLESIVLAICFAGAGYGEETTRAYENRLALLKDPPPLLNDFPEFVEPVRELRRFEAPILVNDEGADLSVRAWRFSYNARGIIEMPNRLRADKTAVIMVHPWGIDDGQGWRTPEPAGVADFCTLEKNKLAGRHTSEVINPLLKRLRDKAAFVMYSLPGKEDPIRKKLYRSVRSTPTDADRQAGAKELDAKLNSFVYAGESLPEKITLSADKPVIDYFQQFPGLDAGPRYNNAGFWDLPIPVTTDIECHPKDVVIYDAEGYSVLKEFLQRRQACPARRLCDRHVLLPHDRGLREPVEGLQCVSRRRRDPGDVSGEQYAEVRNERPHFLRGPESACDTVLVDQAG
jgi:hypothetical protein